MKLVIASDIHGSAYYCRKLLERLEEEKEDRLILLGDVLYHGPRNDLPKDYAPLCGRIFTSFSPCKIINASRIGVRLTENSSHNRASCSTSPGSHSMYSILS